MNQEKTAMQEMVDFLLKASTELTRFDLAKKAMELRDTVEKDQIEKAFDFGKVTEQREYLETGVDYYVKKYTNHGK